VFSSYQVNVPPLRFGSHQSALSQGVSLNGDASRRYRLFGTTYANDFIGWCFYQVNVQKPVSERLRQDQRKSLKSRLTKVK
jgi:hypothetical protein